MCKEVGGEGIVLHMGSGQYFGLNAVGMRMWSLLLESGDGEATLALLAKEFAAPDERLRRDLDDFAQRLLDMRMIERHNQITHSSSPPHEHPDSFDNPPARLPRQ
jgi:Coenzyme PQQ synthesis protein D (PqqD)